MSEPQKASRPPSGTSLSGARVVVSGGAGFIGSHLVDRLVQEGAESIHVLDDLSLGQLSNLADALERPGVVFSVCDVADSSELRHIAEEQGPFDLCFNLAVIPLPHSLEHPRENVDRNVAMTTAICELGRAASFRRLIQFSSSEVYGTAVRHPMGEDHPIHPHTPYAAAKAATDLVALSYATTFGLEVVVVRPFNTYGPRQNDGAYAGLIPAIVRAVGADEPVTINGDGEQTRDMAHVADTVQGTLLAATKGEPGEVYNLGAGFDVSVNELVRITLEALGCPDHPVVHGPPRPGDVRQLLADTRHATERLGYSPSVPLPAGLAETIEWYLQRAAAAS